VGNRFAALKKVMGFIFVSLLICSEYHWFGILPLGRVVESRCKSRSDNELQKSCKVMASEENTNVLTKFCGDVSTATN
jgi:hypothetical protein